MSGLRHRGYTADVEFDGDDMLLVGRLAGIDDLISFTATTTEELAAAFRETVDDYIDTCTRLGKAADRPYSGKVMLRLDPALHARAARAARAEGRSLNQFGADALRRAVGQA